MQQDTKMKITKNQLKRIIKEEKQKLLVEMNPIANAERSLGAYADAADVDKLGTALLDLLQGVEMSAIEDGMAEEEAEDMAADAAILAVAQAFQSAGMIAEYNALYRMIQRG
jgi:hypothetical protein